MWSKPRMKKTKKILEKTIETKKKVWTKFWKNEMYIGLNRVTC